MGEPLPDLTWPGLLAHWTAFAQSSLALPKTAEGERWKAAVAPIIGLQAVTFALGDLDKLTRPGERAAAIDTAQVQIRQHVGELHALWKGEELPPMLRELIDDAGKARSAAAGAGVEWRVTVDKLVSGSVQEVQALVASMGFEGDLYLPVPGAALFRNAPAAFARDPGGARPAENVLRAVKEFLVDVSRPERVPCFRQVYRQFDFGKGVVVRDYVVPFDRELPPGQAQLIPAIERGRVLPVQLPIPGMGDLRPVPVEFAE